jgi:hypothetical protein
MCFAESKAQPHLIHYRPWQGVHCSLVSEWIIPLHCLDHRSLYSSASVSLLHLQEIALVSFNL